MHRSLYERYFDDPAVSALGIYLSPDADLQRVIELVRRATSGAQNLLVSSNRDIRETSLAIFDRTFAVTNVLRLLAVIVAFVGILSAFMALQLERTRELGVLRATGFTPGQVTGMVTIQTGFMGLTAGLLAIPTGLVLAEILIEVINRRSFGWSMKTVVSADVLLQALALALVAAILAGLYPAWRMARTPAAQALRNE
jgi:putative ABC transport system permease protein